MPAAHNIIRLEGRYFGDLLVLHYVCTKNRKAFWRCRCVCGNEPLVSGVDLRRGHVKSCGRGHVYRHPLVALAASERRCWDAMLQRCHNPKNAPAYARYGARGISVCARWREDFTQFLSDMGPRPSLQHSIDRYPDRQGNYEPGNCRWATHQEQADNKDGRIFVEIDGEKVLFREYLRKMDIGEKMVRRRVAKGWSLEDAVTTPSRIKNRTRKCK